MVNRKSYRRLAVKDVCLDRLLDRALGSVCDVGLDIAKKEIVVVIRWGTDDFERPWSVSNPGEIELLISILCRLRDVSSGLRVGLESTGTYGEAIRFAATQARLEVRRVSGKGVRDYKEIFDGVPSQHDGKDAAMIAELTSYGKSVAWPWTERSEDEQEMAHLVKRMDAFKRQKAMWQGRLEGLLARHWPEISALISTRSTTLLHLLAKYGGPSDFVVDREAPRLLKRWSRGMPPSKIDKIMDSAITTKGIPASQAERTWIGEVASEILSACREVQSCKNKLMERSQSNEAITQLKALGEPTMCTLWVTVGDPRNYPSAAAYEKAFGLNLKELSSGKRVGQLAITKRGPSLARRWLYFSALRASRQPGVRNWLDKKKARDQSHGGMKGMIGIMRKLSRSIWHVVHRGEEFAWEKVFPGSPVSDRSRVEQPACV